MVDDVSTFRDNLCVCVTFDTHCPYLVILSTANRLLAAGLTKKSSLKPFDTYCPYLVM